ncbi:MAG: DUF5615 family PIN-like protein [Chloroflexi bacterium]|nr:DUF5615 family PIN-like protein [Chloroflexota bacterium]
MRLLLDAHLPLALARELQRRGLDAVALRDWMGGAYRNASDDDLLAAANLDRRVFVTYDCHSIPPLICDWYETGRRHSGIILIDEGTIRPNDVGSLLRSLVELSSRAGSDEWQDRVIYLQKLQG